MVPDLCPEHMTSKRARGGATYYAHLHTRLPRDILVMHETGFMRFTYFAELALYSNSAWGGQIRKAVVRIPIPVATRVLPENSLLMSARPTPASIVSSPSLYSRASVLVPSISDHLAGRGCSNSSNFSEYAPGCGSVRNAYIPDCAFAADTEDLDSDLSSVKRGRGIAELGNRLQQLIPRKTPNNSPSRGAKGIESPASLSSARKQAFRAVSHGGYIESPASWSVVDLVPPVPARSFNPYQQLSNISGGTHQPVQASQTSLFTPPTPRAVSLSIANSEAVNCSNASMVGASPLRTTRQTNNHQASQPPPPSGLGLTTTGHGGGFSLTFLLSLREFYHVDANSVALDDLVSGLPSSESGNCIIPNAISSHCNGGGNLPKPPYGLNATGAKQWQSSGGGGGSGGTSIRSSMISVSAAVSASERARPKLGHVMTSYRNPSTNQVSTWSAFSSYPQQQQSHGHLSMTPQQHPSRLPVHLRGSSVGGAKHPGCAPSARYSQLSATSVSSNDTACVPNGQLSLPKDLPGHALPELLGEAISESPS
ncbi:hypothetical protein IWW38_004160 [Coemansia aciculifera]|uniref:Uncharacterized protein n=1 Tax=Coemansia aciculifera TaxID=417176 RepID=A0ACC1LZ60_9FUNG|nr:hypothetical protein IWW38_004160 [Coemansia aciculifera]